MKLFRGWWVLLCTLPTLSLLLGFGGREEVFTDVAQKCKLKFQLENSATPEKYLPETMCGGVALFDYDNDGRLDIFFTNGAALKSPMPAGAKPDKSDKRYWNRLFHQNADGSFTDVTERAGLAGTGYSMGVAVGDYDNDGFEDLLVTGLNGATLYHNNGNGTFTDVSAKAGIRVPGWSTSAGFFDFDNDGHLDLFIARYIDWDFSRNIRCGPVGTPEYCHPNNYPGQSSILYRNNGDGTFTDVSAKSGIANCIGKGLGVAFADYDNDGWTDIYLANDSVQSFLFHNNGDGTFTENSIAAGVGYDEDGNDFAGMGVEFSDYDNDGNPDIVVTDLAQQRYMLFRNAGDGTFKPVTDLSGLARASKISTGWGVKWIDVDNDGWKDLFVAQGHTDDSYGASKILTYRQKPLLLRNENGHLTAWPGNAGAALNTAWIGRGVASGDVNNDGAVDVLAANIGERPYMLLNNAAGGNRWIGIVPRGTVSNRDGIGCKIKVVGSSGFAQYFTVNTAGSYLSASDRRVVAGLGRDASVKLIEARWPSGLIQRLENVSSNQWIQLVEPPR